MHKYKILKWVSRYILAGVNLADAVSRVWLTLAVLAAAFFPCRSESTGLCRVWLGTALVEWLYDSLLWHSCYFRSKKCRNALVSTVVICSSTLHVDLNFPSQRCDAASGGRHRNFSEQLPVITLFKFNDLFNWPVFLMWTREPMFQHLQCCTKVSSHPSMFASKGPDFFTQPVSIWTFCFWIIFFNNFISVQFIFKGMVVLFCLVFLFFTQGYKEVENKRRRVRPVNYLLQMNGISSMTWYKDPRPR